MCPRTRAAGHIFSQGSDPSPLGVQPQGPHVHAPTSTPPPPASPHPRPPPCAPRPHPASPRPHPASPRPHPHALRPHVHVPHALRPHIHAPHAQRAQVSRLQPTCPCPRGPLPTPTAPRRPMSVPASPHPGPATTIRTKRLSPCRKGTVCPPASAPSWGSGQGAEVGMGGKLEPSAPPLAFSCGMSRGRSG